MPTATAPIANHLNGEKTFLKKDNKSNMPQTTANGLGHLFRKFESPFTLTFASNRALFSALTTKNKQNVHINVHLIEITCI